MPLKCFLLNILCEMHYIFIDQTGPFNVAASGKTMSLNAHYTLHDFQSRQTPFTCQITVQWTLHNSREIAL